MAKTYTTYYAPALVQGITETPIEKELKTHTFVSAPSHVFLGHRLQNTLLSQGTLAVDLGLYTETQIQEMCTRLSISCSLLELPTGQSVSRLGVMRTLDFTIVPVQDDAILNPYNEQYGTSIPYSTAISTLKAVDILRKARFTFNHKGVDYEYKVSGQSILERRTRAGAPSYL